MNFACDFTEFVPNVRINNIRIGSDNGLATWITHMISVISFWTKCWNRPKGRSQFNILSIVLISANDLWRLLFGIFNDSIVYMCIGLTQWGRLTHICVIKLDLLWFISWLVAWSATSHYPNQWWNIVGWNQWHKFQWLLSKNTTILFKKMHLKNVASKMSTILPRPQYVTAGIHVVVEQWNLELTHWSPDIIAFCWHFKLYFL